MNEYLIDEVYFFDLLFFSCACKNYVVPAADFMFNNKPTCYCKGCGKTLSYLNDDLRVRYKYIKMNIKEVTTGELQTVITTGNVVKELLGCDAKEFLKRYAEDPKLLKKIAGCLNDQLCLVQFAVKEKDDGFAPKKITKIKVKLGDGFTNLLDYVKTVFYENNHTSEENSAC